MAKPHGTRTTRSLRRALRTALGTAAAGAAVFLCGPATVLAATAPTITETSFSEVTASSAELQATVNPGERKTTYFFQYLTQTDWEADEGQFGTGTQTTPIGEINGTATELSADHLVEASISGLLPATAYRFRLIAKNNKGEVSGETVVFATYPEPLVGLPDGRAYEQATPLNKGGGDTTGNNRDIRAASQGGGVLFGSTSGVPGGVGSQEMPLYLASRGAGEAGWSSAGLLPPASFGQKAQVVGWTPDFSEVFQTATFLGAPNVRALFMRSAAGVETRLTPYVNTGYSFAGTDTSGGEAVFEARIRLPEEEGGVLLPGSVASGSNVYAWNRETGKLSLASRMNTEDETADVLPKGAFAGPYEWLRGEPSEGGAGGGLGNYYLQDERAVSADGSVFFTSVGIGHLYQRINPTAPQSPLNGAGECTVPADACTRDLSASERAEPDQAGPQPAAFMAASSDGRTAFFTSSQKLTDDASTGAEVPPPAIGRVTLNGEEQAEEELPSFLSGEHAVGLAVADDHVYWADPNGHAIGRADVDPADCAPNPVPCHVEPDFIRPGDTSFETHPQTEPGTINSAPSTPRYVAVDGEHIYWTNTGPLGGDFADVKQENVPLEGAGTIGRADLDPAKCSPEPAPCQVEAAFITGASNPQGIAVDSEHLYWANSLSEITLDGESKPSQFSIGRATLGGGTVEQNFFSATGSMKLPGSVWAGVVVDAEHVYWSYNASAEASDIYRIPLGGGSPEQFITHFPEIGPLGIAISGTHLYWAAQATGAIGRLPLVDFESTKSCATIPSCEPDFLEPGGLLGGLASDPAENHLYWAANGEIPPHPGNDLYRYTATADGSGHHLTDLTPDTNAADICPGAGEHPCGAAVQGVLGSSEDGKRLYFAANGVLAANPGARGQSAEPGDCTHAPSRHGETTGRCNLYLWEDDGSAKGHLVFIAQLAAHGSEGGDALDWLPAIEASLLNITQKTSFTSADGSALLFMSRERLTEYANLGIPQLYLYRVGKGITCVSCNPTFAPPEAAPTFGRISTTALEASDPAATTLRLLSANGGRAFFETTEALLPDDINGRAGCPNVGGGLQAYPSCSDVYEWEAPGEGSCSEGSPGYAPADEGCLYLISPGKGDYPSILADASASGDDVYFFSREQLVGQDTDQLLDVYDARVGGGIASQNPPPKPPPCEGEACKPEVTAPPTPPTPVTPGVQGTGNVKRPGKCPKGKVRRHGHCVKKHRKQHPKHHHRRAAR